MIDLSHYIVEEIKEPLGDRRLTIYRRGRIAICQWERPKTKSVYVVMAIGTGEEKIFHALAAAVDYVESELQSPPASLEEAIRLASRPDSRRMNTDGD